MLSRGETTPVDYLECETEDRRFLSVFGVAWGAIPDCDIRSEETQAVRHTLLRESIKNYLFRT